MPKERKQNVFFYQVAGNKEPKCLKLVLCQVGLHVVTTQFHLLKQARFQCLNDDVASVWLKNPQKQNNSFQVQRSHTRTGLKMIWGKKKQTTSKEQISKIFRKHCSRPQYTGWTDMATTRNLCWRPHLWVHSQHSHLEKYWTISQNKTMTKSLS